MQLQLSKESHFHKKKWVEGWHVNEWWQNHGSVFGSPRPDGALKPLIRWIFPWEIWFTNIADMIVPLSTPSAPSALCALFGSFWVVLPKRGSQSKKNGNVEGPGIHLFIYYGSIYTFIYLMMTGWWRRMIRTIFITFSSGFWWRHFQSTTEPHFSATSQLSLSTGGVAAREANAFRLQCRLLQAGSLIGHPK